MNAHMVKIMVDNAPHEIKLKITLGVLACSFLLVGNGPFTLFSHSKKVAKEIKDNSTSALTATTRTLKRVMSMLSEEAKIKRHHIFKFLSHLATHSSTAV